MPKVMLILLLKYYHVVSDFGEDEDEKKYEVRTALEGRGEVEYVFYYNIERQTVK